MLMAYGLRTTVYGLRSTEEKAYSLWLMDYGKGEKAYSLWLMDYGLRTTDYSLQTTDYGKDIG